MFIYEILMLTVIIYLILNFSKVSRGIFKANDLILPFSLSFAVTIVDNFIRTAIAASFIAFIVLFAVCFGVLHFVTSLKK